jgi:PAS domain S-box-containing protein
MRLPPRPRGKIGSLLLAALSLGSLAAVVGAWTVLQRLPSERRVGARFWRGQLTATANGRGLAVSRWLKDAVADAHVMAAFPSAQAALESPFIAAGPGHHVREVLQSSAVQLHLRAVSLVGSDGVERASVELAPGLSRAARIALARRAWALGSELVDVQVEPGHVGVLVAVPTSQDARPAQPRGCVVLEEDPEDFLFPLVRQSLGESTTAEVVLWRRDGADARVLAPLRHVVGAEGWFRRPYGSGLFAPATAGPEPEFQEPGDYRGVPVLAARVSLPYGWRLAAKIDRSEALAGAGQRAAWQAAAVGGLGLAALTAAWLVPRLYRARARATLLASRAQIGQLLEQANDALLFSDSGGRIVQANQRAEHMYGVGPGGLVGRSVNELPTPEENSRPTGRLDRVRQRGGVVYESVHRRADGAAFPVEVSVRCSSDGDEDYYVAVVRDISERRAAAARLELLNRTYRTLGEVNALLVRERDAQPLLEGVCRILVEIAGFPLAWAGVKRPDGRVEIKARHGATACVDGLELRWDQGPESDDPLGRALSSGIPTAVGDFESSTALAPLRECARAHGLSTCAAFPIWVAGKVWAALAIYGSSRASMSHEDLVLLQKTADGIGFALEALETERQRRAAVEELRALNAELERRVAQRTSELEAANGELEAFSYSVSHDLRQPLRAVREYAGILEREHANQLAGEGLRLLGIVSSAARRMDRLIEDLLAFARVKRQALRREAVDMGALAQAALEDLAPGPDAEVRMGTLPSAVGDAALLRQVWANLLSNAFKFNRGTAVRVEVGSRSDASGVTYFVRDNGVGFAPEHSERLFAAFQRLHPGQFEGTGIGLAIVARIVARHGGRVWAESTPGEGATFSFTLPQAPAPA